MRNDNFNTILELKIKGYQPSEILLKTLQPDIAFTTFIAVVKIFVMDSVLKNTQDIKPVQSRTMDSNKLNIEVGDLNS